MDDSDKIAPIDGRIAKDARDWVVRLASGTITDAELARLKTWLDMSQEHARAFARERAFWQQLGALDDRADAQDRERTEEKPHPSRRGFLIGGGAIAAAAAGIIVAPKLKLLLGADYRTEPGELREITLSDGTRVTLNTDSALALHFKPGLRLVELLQGEALFEVRNNADALFRVSALGHNVDSLGTVFAVRATADEAKITVSEGHVRVSGPSSAEAQSTQAAFVDVRARQQTSYSRDGNPAYAFAVDLDAELAWRSGRIIFEGRPFSQALAELSRYVPERVVLAARMTAEERVSAIFSTREASHAIMALAQTHGLTARRIPGVMILVS